MTTTPPPPPDAALQAASDTPSAPAVPSAPPAPPAPGGQPAAVAMQKLTKLASATQVLLIVCGALSAVIIATEAFGIGAITAYLSGDDAAIDSIWAYDQVSAVVNGLSGIAIIVTGVLWAIWQYRAAKQVTGRTRRSPGRHASSWFIPVVNLWFPYQNISDLWRAVGLSRPSWQMAWWGLWLGSNVVVSFSNRVYISAETLEHFRSSMWGSLLGEALLLAAAPLAWMVVRGITRGILQRPEQMVAPRATDAAAPPA
ncbi:hypothetical protein GCM10009819_32160 [Agromyces tropicus]|uniref:DUF4328 domain-containing protein n=1 Tax=Agromyces tropicus TaxID=555371 RepID=A0ABP5GHX9_9MICO